MMLAASLYIITCSAWNHLRVRLLRLRQPRYLAGAVAAIVYLAFVAFPRSRHSRSLAGVGRRPMPPPVAMAALLRAGVPALFGLPLLAVAAVGWLVPFDSGLLEFSPAEVQFLFPAPLTRRQLLLHRLMRSQLGLFFASFVPVIFFPQGDVPTRLAKAVALWILFVSARLYFTGVTLARARFGAGRAPARRLAYAPVLVVAVAAAWVAGSVWRAFTASPVVDVRDALARLGALATGGITSLILAPFVALVQPLFGESWRAVTARIPGSLLVAAVLVAWVLYSDTRFQEVATEVADRQASRKEPGARTVHAALTAWLLAPSGRPETAFVWKAVQQTLRVFDRGAMMRVLTLVAMLALLVTSLGWARGTAAVGGLMATAAALAAVVLGPQILRTDLRQDLAHLELLQTWPVRGAAVVRGEMIWPASILSVVAWGATGVAFYLSGAAFPKVSAMDRLAVAGAAALLVPPITFAQFAVHNATVLLLPAWVPIGHQRPRGLEMMGQRLILLGATVLSVAVVCLPGAAVGGVIWFAFRRLAGVLVLVPAALISAIIIGLELLIVTEMLGPLYERLDIVAVERAE